MFGDGATRERQSQAQECIDKRFGGDDLGVLDVSRGYTAGRGFVITQATVTRLKGRAYKPGDTFEKNDPPEDYRDKVRAALKECGLEVV